MALDNNGKITRRKFVKGVAGATICCACFPLDCLAASGEDNMKDLKGKEHLAAACGTYCGACPAYLAKHGSDEQKKLMRQERSSSGPEKPRKGIPPSNWMDGLECDGCLSGGKLAVHCQRCSIRLCALKTQENSRCSECKDLPCHRITNLINMGNYFHRDEYLPNLKKMREMGVEEWIKYEEERWLCPECGLPMRWYDEECIRCGEPRSNRVFPLTEK
jgi:hypothetical protein